MCEMKTGGANVEGTNIKTDLGHLQIRKRFKAKLIHFHYVIQKKSRRFSLNDEYIMQNLIT